MIEINKNFYSEEVYKRIKKNLYNTKFNVILGDNTPPKECKSVNPIIIKNIDTNEETLMGISYILEEGTNTYNIIFNDNSFISISKINDLSKNIFISIDGKDDNIISFIEIKKFK